MQMRDEQDSEVEKAITLIQNLDSTDEDIWQTLTRYRDDPDFNCKVTIPAGFWQRWLYADDIKRGMFFAHFRFVEDFALLMEREAEAVKILKFNMCSEEGVRVLRKQGALIDLFKYLTPEDILDIITTDSFTHYHNNELAQLINQLKENIDVNITSNGEFRKRVLELLKNPEARKLIVECYKNVLLLLFPSNEDQLNDSELDFGIKLLTNPEYQEILTTDERIHIINFLLNKMKNFPSRVLFGAIGDGRFRAAEYTAIILFLINANQMETIESLFSNDHFKTIILPSILADAYSAAILLSKLQTFVPKFISENEVRSALSAHIKDEIAKAIFQYNFKPTFALSDPLIRIVKEFNSLYANIVSIALQNSLIKFDETSKFLHLIFMQSDESEWRNLLHENLNRENLKQLFTNEKFKEILVPLLLDNPIAAARLLSTRLASYPKLVPSRLIEAAFERHNDNNDFWLYLKLPFFVSHPVTELMKKKNPDRYKRELYEAATTDPWVARIALSNLELENFSSQQVLGLLTGHATREFFEKLGSKTLNHCVDSILNCKDNNLLIQLQSHPELFAHLNSDIRKKLQNVTLEESFKQTLNNFGTKPLSYSMLRQSVEIWRSWHSGFSRLFNAGRWFKPEGMPQTLLDIVKLLSEVSADQHPEDELNSDDYNKLVAIIDRRKARNSSSTQNLSSHTSKIIEALTSTTTFTSYRDQETLKQLAATQHLLNNRP